MEDKNEFNDLVLGPNSNVRLLTQDEHRDLLALLQDFTKQLIDAPNDPYFYFTEEDNGRETLSRKRKTRGT
jgi:hypothetical protein